MIVLLLALLVSRSYLQPKSLGQEISQSALHELVSEGRLESVVFNEGDGTVSVSAIESGGHSSDHWLAYPEDDALLASWVEEVTSAGVPVSVQTQTTRSLVRQVSTYLLPPLVIVNLILLASVLITSRNREAGR